MASRTGSGKTFRIRGRIQLPGRYRFDTAAATP